MDKTNAMRLLEAQHIPYRATQYDLAREFHSAGQAAELIGAAAETVFKTLVVMSELGEKQKPLLVMTPAHRQLDLKGLARTLDIKRLRMATQKEAERVTNLEVGGISALALVNRGFSVYLDESARGLERIHVSAGVRGIDLELEVGDLVRLTQARFVAAAGAPELEKEEGGTNLPSEVL